MSLSGRRADQAGVTLVEMLVSVAILGVAVAALVGGLTTAIVISDTHRTQATSDAIARSAAEHIKSSGVTYVDCATAYPVPTGSPTPVASVEYWNGATPAGFSATCPATDLGLQRITVTVPGSDRTGPESVVILKRRR